MITVRITNITLENNRFRVFIQSSNDVVENMEFVDSATSEDIINRVKTRKDYYNEMNEKVETLRTDLLDKEI